MGVDVLIREATIEDAAAIARVHVDGWRWGYRGQLPDGLLASLSVERREAGWREMLGGAEPPITVFVAEARGHVVGFAAYSASEQEDLPPGTAELQSLYLLEPWTGRGVGRALIERVVEHARASDFTGAVLWVLASNDRARRFYEAGGWRADGVEKTERHPREDVEFHEVRYRLDSLAAESPH